MTCLLVRWWGPGALAVCRALRGLPVGFLLLGCSVLFTVEYLYFISLLCLDLYVFGDDALIGLGSFMHTRYLCVLVRVWVGVRLARRWAGLGPHVKYFAGCSGRCFFGGSFVFLFCLVFAMSLCASVYMCFLVTCWERADLLALVCGVWLWVCTFPLVSWVGCVT